MKYIILGNNLQEGEIPVAQVFDTKEPAQQIADEWNQNRAIDADYLFQVYELKEAA